MKPQLKKGARPDLMTAETVDLQAKAALVADVAGITSEIVEKTVRALNLRAFCQLDPFLARSWAETVKRLDGNYLMTSDVIWSTYVEGDSVLLKRYADFTTASDPDDRRLPAKPGYWLVADGGGPGARVRLTDVKLATPNQARMNRYGITSEELTCVWIGTNKREVHVNKLYRAHLAVLEAKHRRNLVRLGRTEQAERELGFRFV
jgi:hypothetical protein